MKAFKLPRNQQFDYKPRFWEQEKEELEQRIKQFEGNEGSPEEMKERISLRFRKRAYVANGKYRSGQVAKSNKTLFLLILLFTIMAMFVLDISMADIARMIN